MPFKSEIKCGFKCVLRTYTLSPHLVPTLCRLRFVSTLCPYALSQAAPITGHGGPVPREWPGGAGRGAGRFLVLVLVLVLVLEPGTAGSAESWAGPHGGAWPHLSASLPHARRLPVLCPPFTAGTPPHTACRAPIEPASPAFLPVRFVRAACVPPLPPVPLTPARRLARVPPCAPSPHLLSSPMYLHTEARALSAPGIG